MANQTLLSLAFVLCLASLATALAARRPFDDLVTTVSTDSSVLSPTTRARSAAVATQTPPPPPRVPQPLPNLINEDDPIPPMPLRAPPPPPSRSATPPMPSYPPPPPPRSALLSAAASTSPPPPPTQQTPSSPRTIPPPPPRTASLAAAPSPLTAAAPATLTAAAPATLTAAAPSASALPIIQLPPIRKLSENQINQLAVQRLETDGIVHVPMELVAEIETGSTGLREKWLATLQDLNRIPVSASPFIKLAANARDIYIDRPGPTHIDWIDADGTDGFGNAVMAMCYHYGGRSHNTQSKADIGILRQIIEAYRCQVAVYGLTGKKPFTDIFAKHVRAPGEYFLEALDMCESALQTLMQKAALQERLVKQAQAAAAQPPPSPSQVVAAKPTSVPPPPPPA